MLTQKMKQPFKTAQPVLFPPLADRAAWESLPGARQFFRHMIRFQHAVHAFL